MLIKNAKIFYKGKLQSKSILIENSCIELIDDKISNHSEIFDANHMLVLPSYVNMHHHLYSSLARGIMLEPNNSNNNSMDNLPSILENLWWKLDNSLDEKSVYYSALIGIMESIKAGATSIVDHHASFGYIDGSLDIIDDAFSFFNIDGTTCFEVSDRNGKEKTEKSIRENERYIKKHSNKIKHIGMHASFTLDDDTLEKCAAVSSNVHMHVAEDISDVNETKKKYGLGIVERLKKYKMFNENSIFAHCIYLDNHDYAELGNSIIVHNPSSNMNNGVDRLKIENLNKKNVLCLGTDGMSGAMPEELFFLHELHSSNTANNYWQYLPLVWENNYNQASRIFDKKIGKLEEFYSADLVFYDYKSPSPLLEENLIGHLMFGLRFGKPQHVMSKGKFVVKDYSICNVDEEEIYNKASIEAESLWKRINKDK